MTRGKCLTEKQVNRIESILVNERRVLTNIETRLLEKEFDLSWLTIKRRSTNSSLDIETGYSIEEFRTIENTSTKRRLTFNCYICTTLYEPVVCKFLARKEKEFVCTKCYFDNFVFTHEWRQKNSESQKIAQNRPDVLEKHRTNSTNMWKRNGFRENYRHGSRLNGSHSGLYDGMNYDSRSELAFILETRFLNKVIKRFDLEPITFTNILGKKRRYYPDFIVDEVTIVEIKSEFWFDKHREDNILKIRSAIQFAKELNMKYIFLFDTKIDKKFMKEARDIHEVKKKNI